MLLHTISNSNYFTKIYYKRNFKKTFTSFKTVSVQYLNIEIIVNIVKTLSKVISKTKDRDIIDINYFTIYAFERITLCLISGGRGERRRGTR